MQMTSGSVSSLSARYLQVNFCQCLLEVTAWPWISLLFLFHSTHLKIKKLFLSEN